MSLDLGCRIGGNLAFGDCDVGKEDGDGEVEINVLPINFESTTGSCFRLVDEDELIDNEIDRSTLGFKSFCAFNKEEFDELILDVLTLTSLSSAIILALADDDDVVTSTAEVLTFC